MWTTPAGGTLKSGASWPRWRSARRPAPTDPRALAERSVGWLESVCIFANTEYNLGCSERGSCMARFRFSKAGIDHWIEQVGIDVRPVVEVRADRMKLEDFATWLTEQWPGLYENVVRGPDQFLVTKKFVFPGKGEVEHPTFTLTNRGVSFVFPRKLSMLEGEEPALPPEGTTEIVLHAMKEFKKRWPHAKQIRYGKIMEYIFDCAPESAIRILAERFCKLAVPDDGELRMHVNRPQGEFNRIIEVQNILKQVPGPDGTLQARSSGIVIKVDFNNRDMREDLEESKKIHVLHEADEFCREELWGLLNEGD